MTQPITPEDVAQAYDLFHEVGMTCLLMMTWQQDEAMTETQWRETHQRLTQTLEELRRVEQRFAGEDRAFRRHIAKARSAVAGMELHAKQHFKRPQPSSQS